MSVLGSWAFIALVVVVLWLFWTLLNFTADAFSQWWNAAHPREDSQANKERDGS